MEISKIAQIQLGSLNYEKIVKEKAINNPFIVVHIQK
jgi:hypothetical protein